MARRARQMGARDIPGAVVSALNKTAFAAREANRTAMPLVFDRPTTFTVNSIVYRRANAQQGLNAESAVAVLPRLVAILTRQELGGDEKGLAFTSTAYENRYGSLTPKQLHNLGKRKNFFFTTIRHTRGLYERIPTTGPLTRDPVTGKFKRRKASRKVKLIVAFVPRGHYTPRFGFMDRSRKTGERTLGPALQAELNRRLSAPPAGSTP